MTRAELSETTNFFLICLDLKILLRQRPIPNLNRPSLEFGNKDQEYLSSARRQLILFKTKTSLDSKILSRPRPLTGLDTACHEFRNQDQESR